MYKPGSACHVPCHRDIMVLVPDGALDQHPQQILRSFTSGTIHPSVGCLTTVMAPPTSKVRCCPLLFSRSHYNSHSASYPSQNVRPGWHPRYELVRSPHTIILAVSSPYSWFRKPCQYHFFLRRPISNIIYWLVTQTGKPLLGVSIWSANEWYESDVSLPVLISCLNKWAFCRIFSL